MAVSPLLPRACRFHPSCSEYASEALARHGAYRGCWLAANREDVRDALQQMRDEGLPAMLINSSQSAAEQRAAIGELHRGFEGLLYVAPERFASVSFMAESSCWRLWREGGDHTEGRAIC